MLKAAGFPAALAHIQKNLNDAAACSIHISLQKIFNIGYQRVKFLLGDRVLCAPV